MLLNYNLRSLFVRRSATLLTMLGIGATVAVIAGVLALEQGFSTMLVSTGRDDVAVMMRPGANNEGDSIFRRDLGLKLIKNTPEIVAGADGQPLASMECFLAIRMEREDGGAVYTPVRGVQQKSFEVFDGSVRVIEGRTFTPGTDEVIVGSRLVGRVLGCRIGDQLQFNTTPFQVVGIFESSGSFGNEVWGDLDRMLDALERYGPNRVVARVRPEAVSKKLVKSELLGYSTRLSELALRLKDDREAPAKILTERELLDGQTEATSAVILALVGMLSIALGFGAVLAAANTMLAAISARTHEIGILLSIGYRPTSIFFSFLFESLLLGLLGGLVGCVMVLPINGVETGAMNFNTFSEVAFAFKVNANVLATAIGMSIVLGVIGGIWPAFRACRMTPTEALRRH